MSELPDNWTHVGGPFYIVRTQAGLKQALKHWGYQRHDPVAGYPRSYPALICISGGYQGYGAVVHAVHLNRLMDKVQNQGKPLPPPPPPPVPPPPTKIRIRLHRESFAGSMQSAEVISATRSAVAAYLRRHDVWGFISDAQIEVRAYADRLDERNKWEHTYILLLDGQPAGFTDGPIQEE